MQMHSCHELFILHLLLLLFFAFVMELIGIPHNSYKEFLTFYNDVILLIRYICDIKLAFGSIVKDEILS